MSVEASTRVLDLRSVFGLTATITVSAEATGGACVEMDCVADTGSATIIHKHPTQTETYEVLRGCLEVYHQGTWHSLNSGESFVVRAGEVHGFRNSSPEPVRFRNRHEPALGFQAHLETLDQLVRAGKVRNTRSITSLIYMSLSAVEHRPDVAVRPPQRVIDTLAFIGRKLGYRLPDAEARGISAATNES